MKKTYAIVGALVVLASIANADIAVNWKNFAAADKILQADGSATLSDGSLLQLIWTPTMQDASISKALVGGGLAVGEVLLQSTTMGFAVANTGRWNTDIGVQVIGDSFVGGSVHDGYFFTRIFETAGAEAGTWYFDTESIAADKVYNPLDTTSIYGADGLAFLSSPVAINANGTQVIPEPATVGLLGVAGLGLFLARRKARS